MTKVYSAVFYAFLLSIFNINIAKAQTVQNATAISEVFGDGVKITTAILTFSEPIASSSLDSLSFTVDGRTVERVYANSTMEKGTAEDFGKYVIIELKSETALKPITQNETQGKMQGPKAGGNGMHGPGWNPSMAKKEAPDTAKITLAHSITTKSNHNIMPDATTVWVARSSKTLVADDFTQHIFHDDSTGIDLKYNLYTPKNSKTGEKYPLLLFIHDASGAGKPIRNTLLQGNGAIVWATPEWQAEHPCYVLAPQFDQVTVDDNFNTTPDLDACLHLLDSLIATGNIDTDRIYTTGQSMGCMSSYVLMLRRPELFASAMLVAGQWNPEVMAHLAKKNLWLLTCKGDVKSSEGIAAAIDVWKANGATVVEQEWALEASPAEREIEVANMLKQGGNIHYTHFAGGSHNNTWRIAYDIEGVRQWLFNQCK